MMTDKIKRIVFPDDIDTAINMTYYSLFCAHSRNELYDLGYRIAKANDKRIIDLYRFYVEFPNSNVPHIEEYGYSEFDVKRYYKRAAAREASI